MTNFKKFEDFVNEAKKVEATEAKLEAGGIYSFKEINAPSYELDGSRNFEPKTGKYKLIETEWDSLVSRNYCIFRDIKEKHPSFSFREEWVLDDIKKGTIKLVKK